jgi:hypothetical protein
MIGQRFVLETLKQRAKKNQGRREFLRKTGGLAMGMAGGMVLSACGGSVENALGQSGPTDAEILNFALNLEYLEASFYQYAANGMGLSQSMLTGTGTQGAITGGTQVNFTDPLVSAYAQEIANDETKHVNFLRTALGTSAVACPAIDVGGTSPTGAFSLAAQAAGLVPAGTAFNPYESDVNFLLAAFLFEDVGVTAYAGASPLISNKTYLQAAAEILAVEAYHAGLIRTVLYTKGAAMPDILTDANAISSARNALNGSIGNDEGITGATTAVANIVPDDSNGLVYSRSYGQVLNIVYLNATAVTEGGFFPSGVNGTLVMSAAS